MSRIYLVTNTATSEKFLRIAFSPAQAIKSVSKPIFTATHVTPMQLYQLQESGLRVESAFPEDESNVITE